MSGLEPRTLQRRFLKATGLRPIEYCQRLRIAKAQTLLQGAGIDEVAWGVGYADQSAFRRLFLRIVGMTPANYRRLVSNKRRERPLLSSVAGSLRGLQPASPCRCHAVLPEARCGRRTCNPGATLRPCRQWRIGQVG